MRHGGADHERAARPVPVPVEGVGVHGDGARLVLNDGRCVQITSAPDTRGARRVRSVLRRVERVEFALDHDALTTSVVGVGHRRRSRVPVSAATGLALALEGTPTTFAIAQSVSAPSAGARA